MKVSWRWLVDLAPGMELSAEAVAERLAQRGAPVEDITYLGHGLEDVVVARVEAVEPHPGADRLSLCTVDAGTGTTHRVVCGAANVRAGAFYPFAPVGAMLPEGMAIRRAKIRGEVSEGMLCSARELGLGSDHTGILELPRGTPGSSLVDALALDDWRLDVEVTANRGDLLSHLGIAREVAPAGDAGLALPNVPGAFSLQVELASHPEQARAGGASVGIQAPDLCSRYLGAVVRGVRVGPSPAWLQARLRAAGARPINNVVDATNYVLLELGQPLHAFDLATLGGSAVVVRRAREGETAFRTLDGVERRLDPSMLMICDAERPVAIAGVMGGEETEVTGSTADVLLECALFDPRSIRATRRTLGVSTDASYRFERGVDPAGMERALRRALELILSTAGGTTEPQVADCVPGPWEGFHLPLRIGRVGRVLGVAFTESELRRLLEPLGFVVAPAGADTGGDETLLVTVPGHRSYDVRREIDLIEEVARTHGYDAFPTELAPYRAGTVPDDPYFQLEDEVRRMLAERGLFEAQTPAFVPEGEGEVRIRNPVSREESHLRKELVPSLVRRVQHNFARGEGDVRLFELATGFRAGPGEDALPREAPRLGLVLTGRRAPLHWSADPGTFDLWDLKGLVEDLVPRIAPDLAVAPGSPPDAAWAVGGETFVVRSGSSAVVGWGGRVAPRAVDAPPWASPVWAFELELPSEPAPRPTPVLRPLPPFPPVERDLALLVPDGVGAGEVGSRIRDSGGPHLRSVEVFDLYRGSGVPEGHRSLAHRLRFQSAERTLTDEEVDAAVARVTARLQEDLDVRVRG